MRRFIVIFAFGIVPVATSIEACKPVRDASDAQEQAQPFVEAGCRALEAFTGDGTVEAICAGEHELAAIADFVRGARADAGRRVVNAPCRIIPSTTTCATDAELAPAIRAIRARRGDGGTP